MSNVYYKFASELNFNHVNFDGLHISVVDLKKAILHQKRLGKATDFDLLVSWNCSNTSCKTKNSVIFFNLIFLLDVPITDIEC